MRMRSRIAAPLGGIALLLANASKAFAGETWCDTDPPVAVRTPAGNTVIVWVVDSGSVEHLVHLLLPSISTETRPAESGTATKVRLTVTIADPNNERYPVRSEVWTGPLRTGTLLSSVTGQAGTPLVHQFKLDVP